MPETISGLFQQPSIAKHWIAESATFQQLVLDGATFPTANERKLAAMERVYKPSKVLNEYDEIDHTLVANGAVITREVDWGASYSRRRTGTGLWKSVGTIVINFDFLIPCDVADEGDDNADTWLANKLGAIWSELETLAVDGLEAYAGAGRTKFNLQSWELTMGPHLMDVVKQPAPDIDAGDVQRRIGATEFEAEFW